MTVHFQVSPIQHIHGMNLYELSNKIPSLIYVILMLTGFCDIINVRLTRFICDYTHHVLKT